MVWGLGWLATLALAGVGCREQASNFAPAQPLQGADLKLFQAAQRGEPASIEAALADGAKVNCRGADGRTPLLELLTGPTASFTTDRRQCVATLLNHGAQPDATDSDKRGPLIYATRLGDLETVRMLVETGIYIQIPDRFHKTALLYAVDERRRDIVAYLAANGELQSLPYQLKKARGL